MGQSIRTSDKSWNSSVRYLPWLPIPIFLVTIIILAIYRSEIIWNPLLLFAALNIIFLSIIMFFVSILALRSYQAKNSIVILLLGSGTLALGLGALLAGLSILGNNVNSTVTIYNTSACISAVLILTSAVLSIKMSLKTLQSKWLIIISYLGIIALITLVALLVRNHIWPVYFVQGTGPTAVDLTVLYTTITLFAISALLLVTYRIKDVLNFRIWYGLGLGLIALGLFSVSIQMSVGDPLNWMGRISQYLGAVYILIAIILSFKETGLWMLPWEQALFESETKYQRIVETANEGIMITDPDGVITFVNKKMADMLGCNDHELIDKSAISLVDPSFQDKSRERIENRKKGITEEYELKFLKKDGSHLWTHVSAAPLYDYTDQYIGILAMFVDNTKRKKIEEDLRKSESKYHSLYASMKEGLAIHEIIYNSNHEPVDYLITDVNPSYEMIIGLSKNDVVGKKATEIYGLEEPPYLEIYTKVAETGEPKEFETHFEPMDIYFNISVISPEKGKFVTVFEDITERKQNEKNLLESEEKYRSIIDNILDAYVRADSNGIITMTSPSAAKMYRYDSPQDMIGIPALSLYKYPTDREVMIDDIMTHGKVEDYESTALRKDGSFFPVSLNAQYHYDANGQIQGTEAFIRDITDRKQIEAA
jgi:PAS domain S-box-containing protein